MAADRKGNGGGGRRRRGKVLEAAIFEIVLRELAETGYVKFSIERVAAENTPAFFSWLGVVPYLTEDAIGSTLDYMASIPTSEVVFDYMEPPQAFSEEIRELVT